ncbi:MAG: nucleotidyltransferase domain-containing protein [Candidatus Marinimicrobia bacterium]|nr:nucleotidyltransferase domain-containing protein [Candidatus Neomarinimicrobiota bacterium]
MSDIIKTITGILRDKVEFALLFGSFVTDNYNRKSDIDIAAFFRQFNMDMNTIIDLNAQIMSAVGRETDLICLNTSDIIITMQVLARGRLIFAREDSLFYQFKARKISEYLDFKMDRKIIEDRLLKGGLYA